ncbi:MAG: hypothetical protein HKN04_06360 [Rhodothermaceae bacterium]|nr:hypothetical protein [Rhodothermaceae bacterium]
MRTLVLLLLVLPVAALAQPERDESGIAATFADLVALAHADSVDAAVPLIACPADTPSGQHAAVPCTPEHAASRARVEEQLIRLRHLFPVETTALTPHYAVEQEGDMGFHLLLFHDLPAAPFVLVAFTDVDGYHLFTQADTEEPIADLPPPPSVVAALEHLMAQAGDPMTTAEAFTPLIVARDGGERAWQEPADPARPDERRAAEQILTRLRALLQESSGGYHAVGYESERESEGTWHVLHVRFGGQEEGERLSFAFLPIGQDFLLGDIDG